MRRLLIIVSAVGGVLLALAVCAALIAPDYFAEQRGDAIVDDAMVRFAKEALQRAAPQATVLTYSNVRENQIGEDAVVCGYVDVHEPEDAFDGRERFIFFENEILLEEKDGTGVLTDRWRDLCESV